MGSQAIIAPSPSRAYVFIDGQNLYHAARKAFGFSYPNYDPTALSRTVCRLGGWSLIQTRFYTGLHSPSENQFWHAFWTAKLAAMRSQGVEVYTRPLRYRKETVILPDGSEHTVRIGEEKGIDVRIALDVLRLALRQDYDVAIVFSQDQDLSDLANDVRAVAREQRRWIKIACAYPVGPGSLYRRGIEKTDWIQIDEPTYRSCLDPTDYRR